LEKHAGELVGFIGLIVFASVLVPGVRAVFSGILVLLLIGLGIAVLALTGWAIYRHYRKQETEYTAAYLGTPSGSNTKEDRVRCVDSNRCNFTRVRLHPF